MTIEKAKPAKPLSDKEEMRLCIVAELEKTGKEFDVEIWKRACGKATRWMKLAYGRTDWKEFRAGARR